MTVPVVETRKSVCCQCTARCGVLVDLQGGLPVSVRGDPSHPVTKGFICPRGRSALEYRGHPDRLTQPLRRVGARGEGRWAPISWDNALDELAASMTRTIASYGPQSIAYLFGTFHGTDQSVGVRLMNQLGSPNSAGYGPICLGPRLVSEALTFGIGPSSPSLEPKKTRTAVLWSFRPTSSNVPAWTALLEFKRAGGHLIVIDPVETIEARSADLWLRIRPAADGALALGLIRELIAQEMHDAEFINRWTIGFDDLRSRVERFTLDYTADQTGLAVDDIRRCATMIADRPCAFFMGLINGMGVHAVDFERARSCLIAISGNLGLAGANTLKGPPLQMESKIDFEGYECLSDTQRRLKVGAQRLPFLGKGYDAVNKAQRRVWSNRRYVMAPSVLAGAHGPSVLSAALTADPYPIRTILIQHANVVANHLDSAQARRSLLSEKVDLVAVHELFHTVTTSCADIVLPAAHFLEKPYMFVRGESGFALATEAVVASPADQRTDYAVIRGLAERLGLADSWPANMHALWDRMLAPLNMTFQGLSSSERNWVNDDSGYHHERIDAETSQPVGFATPSHKVELSSSILASLGMDPLPNWLPPEASKPNRRYPYQLSTGATRLTATHSDHRQIANLRKNHNGPRVTMHPSTAAAEALNEGEWIWIETSNGRIRQQLTLSKQIPLDTIDVERWIEPPGIGPDVLESHANVLLAAPIEVCDPLYGTWPQRMGRCRIYPAAAPAPPGKALPLERRF